MAQAVRDVSEDTPFVADDDDTCHRPTSDDPGWTETTWWSFNVPERSLGGWLHAGYHTNRGTATWRVFVWDQRGASPGSVAYYRLVTDAAMPADPDLRDLTFPSGGFRVRMVRPLMDYEVTYADPEAGFTVELEHRSVHPPQRFTPGEPPMGHNPHLDQLGHVSGTLTLAGEQIAVDCYSIRDRTWGPRGGSAAATRPPSTDGRVREPGGPQWREIERERGRGRIQYIFGHADASTGFLGFVRPQDGDADGWSPVNVGWLLRDGSFQRLDKARSRMRNFRDPDTGWTSRMEVGVTDRTGRTMQAEGTAVSHICEHGAGSNALMRWDFDGATGWGEDQDVWRPDHFARMLEALRTGD